jgi:hypothetical protein
MHPFKESIRFYARNIESLLLLSAVLVVPFFIIHNFTLNYLNLIAAITGAKFVASFFNLFLLLLFLLILQIPFAQYVQSDLDGDERPIRKAFRTFFEHSFSVFVFGIVFSFLVSTGMMLFMIPGLILMILFYLTPFFVVLKKQSAWRCWRAAMEMGKKHFFQIFGLLLMVSVVEWLISLAGLFLVTSITATFGAVMFIELLLNVIVLPFFAVMFMMYVNKWKDEAAGAEAAVAGGLLLDER